MIIRLAVVGCKKSANQKVEYILVEKGLTAQSGRMWSFDPYILLLLLLPSFHNTFATPRNRLT
jgi:hypothetical protein